jgi:hypothetical protein
MKIAHIDLIFEGEQLIDDVKVLQEINPRRVMVYSPKLKMNIIINTRELKEKEMNNENSTH